MSNTVEIEKDELTGDLIVPIPDDLLTELSWSAGDALSWVDNQNGTFTLKKVARIAKKWAVMMPALSSEGEVWIYRTDKQGNPYVYNTYQIAAEMAEMFTGQHKIVEY